MPARTPEETHALIEAAFNAGDLEAFVQVYEEDAQLIAPPTGERVSGREEIRASARPVFDLHPTAEIEVLQKLETDGLALTQARWRLLGTESDGTLVELAGRGTIVSRRQADGTWLIVLDNPIAPE
jgi:uncharacterized protein (TIGR02246 family)